MGSGSSRPAGCWLLDLCCTQTGHAFTKVLTSPRILGHQNSEQKVCCTPAWLVRCVEWPHCKTCDLVELGTKRQPSGASGGQVSDSRAWRTMSSMANCACAMMQAAGRMGSGVRSLSERSNWRARVSTFVFFGPGLYESKTAKEQCPPCLPPVQSSCLLDIGQVLVVCPDLEGVFRPLQPVAGWRHSSSANFTANSSLSSTSSSSLIRSSGMRKRHMGEVFHFPLTSMK